MNQLLSRSLEKAADRGNEIPLREWMTKIYIRRKLFWSCLLIPPTIALWLTTLVPPTWKASVKIMLRYSSSESAFLKDLIPDDRPVLSGASSAEILKSIPTLVQTIREQDIHDEDIYKEAYEVLGSYASGYFEKWFPTSLPPGLPGIDPKTLLLAKSFRDSLEEGSLTGASGGKEKKKPVVVLEKSSQLPASMRGDELITVNVRSFNRNKVAQMANGLASAFIDEYYRVSAEDAHRSYDYLSKLVDEAEADLRTAEATHGVPVSAVLKMKVDTGTHDVEKDSPLIENMSKELVTLQNDLVRLEAAYPNDAEPVRRQRERVQQARADLSRQQQIETAKQVLDQMKVRRFQALNTEHMYQARLIPISIVEPAFTPKKSFSKVALRYVLSGSVGLALGLVLAFGLIIVLDAVDPYLYTSWQVEKRSGLSILAALPDLGRRAARQTLEAANDSSVPMVNGLLQLLGRMKRVSKENGGRVVVITGAAAGEGKTFLTLALGGALANAKRHRVLLVDADLKDGQLTQLLDLSDRPGYVDAMLDRKGVETRIVEKAYRDCDVLPAGDRSQTLALGLYGDEWADGLAALRSRYDFILVDTAGVLAANEGVVCGHSADNVLVMVSSGRSRKALLEAATQRLTDAGVVPDGIVLNRKRAILPSLVYRNV